MVDSIDRSEEGTTQALRTLVEMNFWLAFIDRSIGPFVRKATEEKARARERDGEELCTSMTFIRCRTPELDARASHVD